MDRNGTGMILLGQGFPVLSFSLSVLMLPLSLSHLVLMSLPFTYLGLPQYLTISVQRRPALRWLDGLPKTRKRVARCLRYGWLGLRPRRLQSGRRVRL